MKRSLAAAFAVLAVLAFPASAHQQTGGPLAHVSVQLAPLEPGESRAFWIEPGAEEGPWRAGMVIVLFVQFYNEARDAKVELLFSEVEVVKSWRLTDDVHHKVSTVLPFDDGPYELRFTNNATAKTQILFFFDQTCNCTAKPIPLDEGWVVFHYDFKADRRFLVAVPVLVENWTVQGQLAWLRGEDGRWPDDFEILEDQTVSGGWLNFTGVPESDRRYYIFYHAVSGSPSFPSPDQYVFITPLLEVEGEKAPSLAFLGVVAAIGAAALVQARRR